MDGWRDRWVSGGDDDTMEIGVFVTSKHTTKPFKRVFLVVLISELTRTKPLLLPPLPPLLSPFKTARASMESGHVTS